MRQRMITQRMNKQRTMLNDEHTTNEHTPPDKHETANDE